MLLQLNKLLVNVYFSSQFSLVDWDSDCLGKSSSVVWVDLVEVCEHSLLNISSSLTEWSGQVGDQMLSVSLGENLLPQSSWLLVVGIWVSIFVSTDLSGNVLLSPGILRVLNWSSESVWLIVWTSTLVSVNRCRTISEIVSNSSSVWAVNWNLIVVLS